MGLYLITTLLIRLDYYLMENMTNTISADHICSEYYYYLLKRRGINVPRKRIYKNVHNKINEWKYYESLANICNTYKIDYEKYITYLYENHWDNYFNYKQLINIKYIRLYAEYLDMIEKQKKVYNSFIKTANFIADECIRMNYESSTDYIKYLIVNNKLSAYIMAGKISKYWIAAISKLPIIVKKLNVIDRESLNHIVNNQLKLNDDLQESFIRFKSFRVRPFNFTDKLIENRN